MASQLIRQAIWSPPLRQLVGCSLALLFAACNNASERAAVAGEPMAVDSVWAFKSDILHEVEVVRLNDTHALFSNKGTGQVIAVAFANDSAISVGRRGPGPGEFKTITDIALLGDTALVLDGIGGQVHRYLLRDSARFLSTVRLPENAGTAERVFVRDNGRVVVAFASGAPKPGAVADMTVVRDSIVLLEIHDGASVTTSRLAQFPSREYFFGVNEQGQRWLATPAFATRSYFDLHGAGVVIGDARVGTVIINDLGGKSNTLFSFDMVRPVTEADLKAFRDRIATRAARVTDGAQYSAMASAALDVWKEAPPLPHIDALSSDKQYVVIRPYVAASDGISVWIRLSLRDGSRSTFILPPRVRITAVKGDTLIGVSSDSLDVQSILMIRLRANQ